MPARDEKNGFEMELLGQEKFAHYWPAIEAMMKLVPHTWQDHLTFESTYARAMNESLQVWAIGAEQIKLVLFTQIAMHPAARHFEIIWACGSGALREATEVVDATFERFAQKSGCAFIDIIGREGWERYLSPRGFKKIAVVLSRPVRQKGLDS